MQELNEKLKLWISCFVAENDIDTDVIIMDKEIEVAPGKTVYKKVSLQDYFDFLINDEDEAYQNFSEPHIMSFWEASSDAEEFCKYMGELYEQLVLCGLVL